MVRKGGGGCLRGDGYDDGGCHSLLDTPYDQDCIAHPCTRDRYTEELDPYEDSANESVDGELPRVGNNEREGEEAGPAKGRALHCDVDEAVVCDELDCLLEAPEAAVHALDGDH